MTLFTIYHIELIKKNTAINYDKKKKQPETCFLIFYIVKMISDRGILVAKPYFVAENSRKASRYLDNKKNM